MFVCFIPSCISHFFLDPNEDKGYHSCVGGGLSLQREKHSAILTCCYIINILHRIFVLIF